MEKHVRTLGWLYIAMAVFDLMIGALVFTVLAGVGAMSGNVQGFGALAGIGGIVATLMVVLAIPNLVVGLGFLRNWGGWVIILASFLALLNFAKPPIGTAISIYTFWVAWKLYNAQPDSPPGPAAT